jgi:crotonobetainyl-CoA:carnitine CoA-transferase CaiB-like acyl-CoA transferase
MSKEIKKDEQGMLSPYRVLDLTDEKGLLCGKLLGDLGADVIKVERPGGDPARNIGPFYNDEIDPEKSLFWFAFNASKRGIILDIKTDHGREDFKKLVKSSDIVIESFPPGYMDGLGLGYSSLEKVNPGIVLVSISPFGQTGPYRDYKTPGIVAWAMGGYMSLFGDPDRPPVQVSHHSQAYLHASAAASGGALMALFHRHKTGQGQHVDVSIQECVAQCLEFPAIIYDMTGTSLARGEKLGSGLPWKWPCKDGYVAWTYYGGAVGERYNRPLLKWMKKERMNDDFLDEFDWGAHDYFLNASQEIMDRIIEPTTRFFMSHTKEELYEGAADYKAMLFPVATMSDTLESTQLASRKYWTKIEHPELDTSITYPGSFAVCTKTPPVTSRRAPLIGEHSHEILDREQRVSDAFEIPPQKNNQKTRPRNTGKILFEGIRIADFSRILTGPLTTKIFSDYGAEVIKIESLSQPELFRLSVPFKDNEEGLNRAGRLNWANTGKLSVSINFHDPRGVELAKRIAAWADIVVENTAGGSMKRMGLGYEELKEAKSDLIMLSTCMQGQTGPHAAHPGFGMQMTALTGFDHITGWPDREPVGLSVFTDFIAPHFNLLTILAALDHRRRTGQGQFIDMSQYENALHYMAPLVLDYVINKRVAGRMGNRSPDAAPHGAYQCRGEDRWCVIAVYTDEEWEFFTRAIGNPAWTRDPRFNTLAARKENEDALNRNVEKWTLERTDEEVMNQMQKAGVAAGAVRKVPDILDDDPQIKHRHFVQELAHPEVGSYRALRPHFILSKSPCEMRRAPLLGEHNQYVFKDLLCMSDEEISDLVIAGIIE